MHYQIAADLLVLTHLGFIVFVIVGGVMAMKWSWLMFLHIPAAVWGVLVVMNGWICPLTPWENQLRNLAGQEGYSSGFIEHYIIPLIYPSGLTRDMQIILGLFILTINLFVYGFIIYRLIHKDKLMRKDNRADK